MRNFDLKLRFIIRPHPLNKHTPFLLSDFKNAKNTLKSMFYSIINPCYDWLSDVCQMKSDRLLKVRQNITDEIILPLFYLWRLFEKQNPFFKYHIQKVDN